MTIELHAVSKSYETHAGQFDAVRELSLNMTPGEFVGLVGPSGSGKSTLLNLISGLDHPSSGEVRVGGERLGGLSETKLASFRGRNIGFVFQFFQLVPTLTVFENVMLAMDLVGMIKRSERHTRALELLDQFGVLRHKDKMPSKLSGGEQQRVAIARALANDPPILVADEPTGNLDSENSDRTMDLFANCADGGRLVIVATHDTARLNRLSRVLTLRDGALVNDRVNGHG
jgi:putative ABC transport system ATP-binding protein